MVLVAGGAEPPCPAAWLAGSAATSGLGDVHSDSWSEFEQKMLRAKLGFGDADCALILDAARLERCRAAALAARRAARAAGDGDEAKRRLELALQLGNCANTELTACNAAVSARNLAAAARSGRRADAAAARSRLTSS